MTCALHQVARFYAIKAITISAALITGSGCSQSNIEVYGDKIVDGGFCVPEAYRLRPPFWLSMEKSEYRDEFFIRPCSNCELPAEITSAGIKKCDNYQDWHWSKIPTDSYYFRLMINIETETSIDKHSGLYVSRNTNIDPGILFISEIKNKYPEYDQTKNIISHGELLAVCYESNKNNLHFRCSRQAKIKGFCISYDFYSKSLPPKNIWDLDKSLWQKFNGWKCKNLNSSN